MFKLIFILTLSSVVAQYQPLNRYQALLYNVSRRIAMQRQNLYNAQQQGYVTYQPYIVWLANRSANNLQIVADNLIRTVQHLGSGAFGKTDEILRSNIPALVDGARINLKDLYDKTPNLFERLTTTVDNGLKEIPNLTGLLPDSRNLKDKLNAVTNNLKDRLITPDVGSNLKNHLKDKLSTARQTDWRNYLPDSLLLPPDVLKQLSNKLPSASDVTDRLKRYVPSNVGDVSTTFNDLQNGLSTVADKTLNGIKSFLPTSLLRGENVSSGKRTGLKDKLKKAKNTNPLTRTAKNLKDNINTFAAVGEYLPYIKSLLNVVSYLVPGLGQYKEAKLAMELGEIAVKAANNYKNGDDYITIGTKAVGDTVKAALRRRSMDEMFTPSSATIGDRLNIEDIPTFVHVVVNLLSYPRLTDQQESEIRNDVTAAIDRALADEEDRYSSNNRDNLIDSFVKLVKYSALYEILPDTLLQLEQENN